MGSVNGEPTSMMSASYRQFSIMPLPPKFGAHFAARNTHTDTTVLHSQQDLRRIRRSRVSGRNIANKGSL